jgi:hypothetical protein
MTLINLNATIERKQTVSAKIVGPIQFSQSQDIIIATVPVDVIYKMPEGAEFKMSSKVTLNLVQTPDGLKVSQYLAQMRTQ